MRFQNIKTGNILSVTDKTTITLMSKQTDTYRSIKDSGAKNTKPSEKNEGGSAN